jgi:glycosyltransferase involved in cell wall biosynthesis
VKKQQPLLSIAIPTWNREAILNDSLKIILPQIISYAELIELIISDNGSTDKTDKVVKNNISNYTGLNIVHFRHSDNTGYYGNFKKCKELATGKYFWLLSDNEHLKPGIIDIIIQQLKSNEFSFGCLFLEDSVTYSNEKTTIQQFIFNDIISQQKGYLLTLISSVIMLNDKNSESEVIHNFKENSFLGFLFLINSLKINNNIVVLKGKIWESVPCSVSFNIFQSWTYDIQVCVKYMEQIELIDSTHSEIFVNSYLQKVLRSHVFSYKIHGNLFGKTYGSLHSLEHSLKNFYGNYSGYEFYIDPIFKRTRTSLMLESFIRKYRRLISAKAKQLTHLNLSTF